jgi:hypothetical protein
MRYLIVSIVCLCISAAYPTILPIQAQESLQIEHFTVQHGETIGVLGYSYKRFFDPSFYWGGSGYGAIAGQRGGFFIGGFVLGKIIPITETLAIEPQIFVGGGGGHAAPQGGGGIIRPSLSLVYSLKPLAISLTVGHIRFINGAIDSDLLSFGLSWDIYEIIGVK